MSLTNPSFVIYPDLYENEYAKNEHYNINYYERENKNKYPTVKDQLSKYFGERSVAYNTIPGNNKDLNDISNYTFVFPSDLWINFTVHNKQLILKNYKFLVTGNPNDITNFLLINVGKYLEIIKMDIQRFYNLSSLKILNNLNNNIDDLNKNLISNQEKILNYNNEIKQEFKNSNKCRDETNKKIDKVISKIGSIKLVNDILELIEKNKV